MRSYALISIAAAFGTQVLAACNSALKVDDFSKWSSNTNSLGEWTSDDGTMSSISASGGVLSFKPKTSSYFYETFPCQAASSNGYSGVQFTITGPAKGSVVIELQTKTACSNSAYKSAYYQVTGLTGSSQTVTLPFTDFSGANGNAVSGIVYSGFSSTTATWKLSNIQFACSGSTGGGSSAAPSPSAVRSSSAAQSSSASKSSSIAVSTPVSKSSSIAVSTPISKSSSIAVSTPISKSSSIAVSTPISKSSSIAVSTPISKSSSVASSVSISKSSSVASSISVSKSSSVASSNSVAKSSSTVAPSSSKASSVSASRTTMVSVASVTPSGTCSPLLIDDWISQSRLTFLFYNSFNYPSSDDATCTSLTVGKPKANHLTIVPKSSGDSYFYSQFPCVNAKNKYGGISLRIKAPKGTTLSVELDSSDNCNVDSAKAETHSSAELGWTFDGTEKLYLIPFSKYPTLNTEKLVTILFGGMSQTLELGPMAFYCGSTGEYVAPPVSGDNDGTATVSAPANPSATALVVDKFANADSNAMGNWHGGDEGMTLKYSSGKLTITSNDADYSFYTQLSASCSDFSKYKGSYLHIAYTGSTKFTVALQQHNQGCNADIAPFPETWDSAEASRYAKNGHIYIPMSHFKVDFSRVIGFALKGFYTSESVTLSVIEIVPSIPTTGVSIPAKDDTGNLIFACKRPNSFAFAIDDGVPELAQEVLKIIREENIKVTFFTVGAPLLDQSTNLTNVYKEMQAAGHQLALHSFTHPKMEGLPDYAGIDWEYNEDIKAMKSQFNGYTTPYFRPPFGNEGARMRSRLVKAVGSKATITNWSVDVEDWLWATTSTPEQQKVAFQRDVNKGGNLVVLHYLYPSTVSYLKEFIQIAKATGKDLMRVDQCMEDPDAPPYVK